MTPSSNLQAARGSRTMGKESPAPGRAHLPWAENRGLAAWAERTYHGQDLAGHPLGLLQVLRQDRCEVVPACSHTQDHRITVGNGAALRFLHYY